MTTSTTVFCFQPTLLTDPFPYLSSDTSRILHIKGWASRLTHNDEVPVDLEALMTEFDVFAFDGDDLKNDSFTKFLAVMVCRRFVQPRGTPTVLWAIKYIAEVEEFLASWTGSQKLHCGDEITTISAPPNTSVPSSSSSSSSSSSAVAAITADSHQPNPVIIPLYYTCIDAATTRVNTAVGDDDDPEYHYRYLGEQGLAFTQAVNVATIGGGS